MSWNVLCSNKTYTWFNARQFNWGYVKARITARSRQPMVCQSETYTEKRALYVIQDTFILMHQLSQYKKKSHNKKLNYFKVFMCINEGVGLWNVLVSGKMNIPVMLITPSPSVRRWITTWLCLVSSVSIAWRALHFFSVVSVTVFLS